MQRPRAPRTLPREPLDAGHRTTHRGPVQPAAPRRVDRAQHRVGAVRGGQRLKGRHVAPLRGGQQRADDAVARAARRHYAVV